MHVMPSCTGRVSERCACGAGSEFVSLECTGFLGRRCLAPLTDNDHHDEQVWPRGQEWNQRQETRFEPGKLLQP